MPKSLKEKNMPPNPSRIVIEHVQPEIDGGAFPVKRTVGEEVAVSADIFIDGHESVQAVLLYRKASQRHWSEVPMTFRGNDRWTGRFLIEAREPYLYTIQAWLDEFSSWRIDLHKKWQAGQDVDADLLAGVSILQEAGKKCNEDDDVLLKRVIRMLTKPTDVQATMEEIMGDPLAEVMSRYPAKKSLATYNKELPVRVDRPRSAYSTWYEFFPRSWGTFKDCERIIPEISRMGFDVVYFPPIHPVGVTNRKGRNNAKVCVPGDPGSPWAIGSKEGGHKAVHPDLGSLKDFQSFIRKSREYGIEVALDLAYQCSPDHPYVQEHPGWFKWRPDGTVQFAENPPKKYEDVLPVNFQTGDWPALWEELKGIVEYWIGQGVTIFRVDNPHTKPFVFWDWLISEIRKKHDDVIFLAEAFTRPRVLYRLAKGGFDQSYTYFTWRNTKEEFIQYMTELTATEAAEYCRPNFWTNTPDILPEHLQYGGRPAFMMRVILAATLSSNYGIYGPAFELCVSEAVKGKEEYLNSEKYEIKKWDWDREGNLKDFIARVNTIRRENTALQETRNIRFCPIDNPHMLAFLKVTRDQSNIILVVINLDAYHTQSGWVHVPVGEFGIEPGSYLAHDLLGSDKYIWTGEHNYVQLNPQVSPAHIIKLHHRIHREQDFDYFM